jgi:pyruvoyl-dependent arginine decarboxylase (PvlArgDC)
MTRKLKSGIVLECVTAASASATPSPIASTANSPICFDP